MPKITITIGGNYFADLDARLKKYKISHGELAREMGISHTQLSRWFNKPILPRMQSVERIENAVLSLRRKRQRKTEG